MEEKEKKLEMELHAEMEAIEVDRKELQYLPPGGINAFYAAVRRDMLQWF